MKTELNIRTVVNEPKRGCGFRKEGGLYLVSGALSMPCGRLPLPLLVCPVCHAGIKFSRGFTWILPRPLFALVNKQVKCKAKYCKMCPVSHPPERAGLIWVGECHYDTPAQFCSEAAMQGISRRISAVPKDFVLGETFVYLAHRAAIYAGEDSESGKPFEPGIFQVFRPTAIEYIVKKSDSKKKLVALQERGVSLVKIERT